VTVNAGVKLQQAELANTENVDAVDGFIFHEFFSGATASLYIRQNADFV